MCIYIYIYITDSLCYTLKLTTNNYTPFKKYTNQITFMNVQYH